jgi:hypothetical protein
LIKLLAEAEWSKWPWPWDHCPWRVQTGRDRNGEPQYRNCRQNGCLFCGPRKAAVETGAISLAGPGDMITFTQPPEVWAGKCRAMRSFRQSMRRAAQVRGQELEWISMVEPYKKGGSHLHVLVRGLCDPVSVQKASSRAGLGYAEIEPPGAFRNFGYGLKIPRKLLTLGTAEEARYRLDQYLDLNGGRLHHATHGFWLDREGQPTDARGAMHAYLTGSDLSNPELLISEESCEVWLGVRYG